jgi:GNAT superfamily N-acetyltransferase
MDLKTKEIAVAIRSIAPDDAPAVADLIGQLGHSRTADQVREWMIGLERRHWQAAFVAVSNGEVVGWIEVSLEHRLQYDPLALIGGLVVKDGLRSLGIGRLLCERVESWAHQQGVKKVRVTSRSTREAAHRFYLRDGYRQTKISMFFEKPLEP